MRNFGLNITLIIAAAIIAACSPAPQGGRAEADMRVCRDAQGKRVSDIRCEQIRDGGGARPGFSPFYWWYINRGGYYPYVGSGIREGSTDPIRGVSSFARAPALGVRGSGVGGVSSVGGVARGGFGATAVSTGAAG